MGWGTGNLGGGSGGLNFKVVSYATESELLADTPKENTIGIITTNKITGWLFSATEPESPTEGMVWISTGASSTIEFNALKKNGLQVYPISVKQYVSGAWVSKTAESYQDGGWKKWWTGTLYDNGDEIIAITGGWSTTKTNEGYGQGLTVSNTDDGLYVTCTNTTSSYGFVHTNNKIDLTIFTTLTIVTEYPVSGGGFWNAQIVVNDELDTSYVATVSLGTPLDVSDLKGEYYVGLELYNGFNERINSHLLMKSALLE